MKLIVIQHALRGSVSEDFDELAGSVVTACAIGGDVVVVPAMDAVREGVRLAPAFVSAVGDVMSGVALLPYEWEGVDLAETPLGVTVLLSGDESLDVDLLDRLYAARPDALVIRTRAESSLQAEAFIEHAIALSSSVAPLVVVVDPVGQGEDGELEGFGGTSVAIDGEVVAEAESETQTELLEVELDESPGFAGVRERRPGLPGVLAQRWAHHHGTRAPIDYPADLS